LSEKFEKSNLEQKQFKILDQLSEIIGKKIPHLDEKGLPAFGFKSEGNNVIGLWLAQCELKIFPEPVIKLESLMELYLSYN